MSSQRLVAGTRFTWKGVTYEVRRVLPDDKLNIEDLYTGAVSIVSSRELVSALFAGELVIAVPAAAARGKSGLALEDYPPDLVGIARRRLDVIQELVDMEPGARTRAAVDACARKAGVDTVTLYRWIDAYETCGRDLRALIPAYPERGGKGGTRLEDVAENIVDSVIHEKYLVPEKVTVKDIWYEVTMRIKEENRARRGERPIAVPSSRTVYRRVEALGMAERFVARRGKEAARRALAQYGASERPTHAFERIEFDNTRADFMVVDDADDLPLGRLNLTTGLCAATGYPAGYYLGFEPPGVYSLMECLYHTICLKPDAQALYGTEHTWLAYGVPFAVAVDNGKEFLSIPFEDACGVLGIQVMRMPVRTPHYKATVERFFGTLNTGLFHIVPGSTFSNPTARGDYKSMEQACIYLSEVDRLLHLFLLDVYAEEFHKGLNGVPARLWENAIGASFAPALPPGAKELRILLGRAETRIIHHYGVELENLRFNHPDLSPLRARLKGQPAKVRYHPGDLSRVYALDPFENRYIEVPALARDYTRGLSLWKHRVILNYVKSAGDRVDIAALARAKRIIQEIVDRGRGRRKAANRARQGRWNTAGKPTRLLNSGQAVASPPVTVGEGRLSTQSLETRLLGLDRGRDWRVDVSPGEVQADGE